MCQPLMVAQPTFEENTSDYTWDLYAYKGMMFKMCSNHLGINPFAWTVKMT